MSKRTLALIIILVIITAVLFKIAITPSGVNLPGISNKTTGPTPTPVEQTSLYLSPSTLAVSSPSGSVDVDIDTSLNKVSAVQLELSYDPRAISIVDINPGTFFEQPGTLLKTIDAASGRISYALVVPPNLPAKQGKGTVAKIQFMVLSQGQSTAISFLPKTQVTAEGVNSSVLKLSTGATISFPTPSLTAPR